MNARLRREKESESDGEVRGRLRRLEGATLGHAHKFIISRWRNLQEVRRMAGAWLLAIAALILAAFWQGGQFAQLYTIEGPAEDTTYTEGVVGTVDNLNPIFVSTPAEKSVSKLLFASLFAEDERGVPQPQLVQNYTLDGTGKVYTMTLRKNVRWQDGAPLTANDVAYTFATIKDASTHSQLYSSWRNIAVEKIDDYTVRFSLPAAYTPFLHGLNIGILPEHILGNVRPSELRSHSFSRSPTVGSGPFAFQDARTMGSNKIRSIVRMDRNDSYFLGAPKLSHYQLHAYGNRDDLANAYRTQEVAAIGDESNDVIESAGQRGSIRTDSPLYNGVYAFLCMDSPMLSDLKVRNALELATDQKAILDHLHGRVQPVTGPLLSGQLGYDPTLKQAPMDLTKAKQLLEDAGWKIGNDGKRHNKDGMELRLQFATLSGGDFPAVAKLVMDQWSKLGVSFDSQLVKPEDIQQNVVSPRAYDVLLYELAIGSDSDVYAYWHSSQSTSRGFNLSGYRSSIVDDALDSARARADNSLRVAKYRNFTEQWLKDVPAIGMYRPNFTYIETKGVTSFGQRQLSDPTDRFENVRFWSAAKDKLRPTL